HGSTAAKIAQTLTGLLPDAVAAPLMSNAGVDRLAALNQAIDTVRRSGVISVIGVYGGMTDPMPMLRMFDKGITLRMGQAHVRRWISALMPLVTDDADPLGVMDLTTHRMPLERAPQAYEMFQKKSDGAVKILLQP
ncbi:glutathione-dependent formaldehyde dehydrogenase, partial [Nonomuraea fuscirosea]